MPMNTRLEKIILGFALGLPGAVALALMFLAPGSVSTATYGAVVALLLGTATVALHTWKSAQATGSVGQLLYETNTGQHIESTTSPRRTVILVVLSLVTTAVIIATWLL